jgi:TolA-binding protein
VSDLTRWTVWPGPERDGEGEWVKAEEAEARIAELEKEIGFLKRQGVAAQGSAQRQIKELEAKIERLTNRGIEDMKFTIAEQEARLRAADELADRADDFIAANLVPKVRKALIRALTAYREAGK